MTPLQIAGASFCLLSGIVTATVAVESRYEKALDAEEIHELLAESNETARLQTQLEIIKIKLEKYRDLGNVRQLTEGEQIELRSIERERDVILQRLATKG